MHDAAAEFRAIWAAVNSGVPAPYCFAAGPDECQDLPTLESDWAGVCVHRPCPTSRAFIEARTTWRGPAPVIVVDVRGIEEEYGDDAVQVGRGVFIHELAHATRFKPQAAEPPRLAGLDLAIDRRAVRQIVHEARNTPRPLWCDDHGKRFVRATIHLGHRAGLAGYPVWLGDLDVAGEHRGLSSPWEYLNSLADELESLQHVPVAQLENIDPPSAFVELWESDTSVFLENAR